LSLAVNLGGPLREPPDIGISQDDRDKVLLEVPKVDRTPTEFERLLYGPPRPQGVVEALRELNRRLVADILAHPDDKLDMAADGPRLYLGKTGVEDHTPNVIRT